MCIKTEEPCWWAELRTAAAVLNARHSPGENRDGLAGKRYILVRSAKAEVSETVFTTCPRTIDVRRSIGNSNRQRLRLRFGHWPRRNGDTTAPDYLRCDRRRWTDGCRLAFYPVRVRVISPERTFIQMCTTDNPRMYCNYNSGDGIRRN